MTAEQPKRKQRTPTQSAALHLYLERLAEALNDAGYDMKKTLKPGVDIPWTKEMAKEFLWKPIQEAMTGKSSTTELNTCEPSDIHLVLSRHIGEKFGVYVSWPSHE